MDQDSNIKCPFLCWKLNIEFHCLSYLPWRGKTTNHGITLFIKSGRKWIGFYKFFCWCYLSLSLSLFLSGQKSGSNKSKTCSCNSPILTVGNLSSRDLSDEMRPTLHLHLQLCPLVHNSSNSCPAICFPHIIVTQHQCVISSLNITEPYVTLGVFGAKQGCACHGSSEID